MPITKVKTCKQIIRHFFSFQFISRHTVIQKHPLTACLFSMLLAPALLVCPALADDLSHSLVKSIEKSLPTGWSIDGKPYHYDNSTLYTYIDGGADIFLKHGFKQLTGAVCKSSSHPLDAVTIDIYVLSGVQNASALFARKKSGKTLKLKGAGVACEGKGYLCMYNSKLYIELQVSGASSSDPSFMRQIASSLLRKLP